MQFQLALVIATIITTIVSSASAQTPDPIQFVGFSSNTFNGGQGVLTYTNACHIDFGAQARMCTTKELMDTMTPPTPAPEALVGWVEPSGVQSLNHLNGILAYDSRSLVASEADATRRTLKMNCDSWSATTGPWGGLTRIIREA